MKRIGWLISKYLVQAIVPYFVFSWLLLSVILFVQQASRFADIFFSVNIPTNLIWQLSLALVPNVIAFTCPMAMLVGTIIGLSKMQEDSELVAIRAAGVGNLQIAVPIIILGVLLSAFAFLVNLKGVPIAAKLVRNVALQTAIKKLESPIEPGVFNTEVAGYTIYVKGGDIETGRWRNVFIYSEDPANGVVRLITSQRGRIDTTDQLSELVLENASVSSIPRTPGVGKYVTENIGDVRLAIKTKRSELLASLGDQQGTAEELGLTELSDYAKEKTGADRIEAQILLQRRLLLSVSPLIFCLLGTAMILRFNRGGRGFATLMALGGLVCYYLLTFLGEQLARTGKLNVYVGGAIPVVVSAGAIFWFMFSTRIDFLNGLGNKFSQLTARRTRTETVRQTRNLFVDLTTGLRDFDLIANLLRYFALSLGFLTAVFMIFTAFELWRFAGVVDGGTWMLTKYLIYLIPFVYLQLAPSAAMVATIATYVIKSRQNEIVTWTSAGQSVYRLMVPCFLLMVFLGFMNFGVQEWIAPKTNPVQDTLRNQIRKGGVVTNASGKYWVANDRRIYSFEMDAPTAHNNAPYSPASDNEMGIGLSTFFGEVDRQSVEVLFDRNRYEEGVGNGPMPNEASIETAAARNNDPYAPASDNKKNTGLSAFFDQVDSSGAEARFDANRDDSREGQNATPDESSIGRSPAAGSNNVLYRPASDNEKIIGLSTVFGDVDRRLEVRFDTSRNAASFEKTAIPDGASIRMASIWAGKNGRLGSPSDNEGDRSHGANRRPNSFFQEIAPFGPGPVPVLIHISASDNERRFHPPFSRGLERAVYTFSDANDPSRSAYEKASKPRAADSGRGSGCGLRCIEEVGPYGVAGDNVALQVLSLRPDPGVPMLALFSLGYAPTCVPLSASDNETRVRRSSTNGRDMIRYDLASDHSPSRSLFGGGKGLWAAGIERWKACTLGFESDHTANEVASERGLLVSGSRGGRNNAPFEFRSDNESDRQQGGSRLLNGGLPAFAMFGLGTAPGLALVAASDNEKRTACPSVCVKNLTVYEFASDNNGLQSVYRGGQAQWADDRIIFSGPVEHSVLREGRISTETINGGELLEPDNPFTELGGKPSHMTIAQIRHEVSASESDAARRNFAVALEKRYSTLFLPFVIALFTAPFALSLQRSGRVVTVGYAIGLWLVYTGVTYIFEEFGLNGFLTPSIAVYSPVVIFSMLGVYLLSKVRT